MGNPSKLSVMIGGLLLLPVRIIRFPFDTVFLTWDFLRVTIWGLRNGFRFARGRNVRPFRPRFKGKALKVGEEQQVRPCALASKYGTKSLLMILFPSLGWRTSLELGRYLAWVGRSSAPPSSLSRYILTALFLAGLWGLPASWAWRQRWRIAEYGRGETARMPGHAARVQSATDPELAARRVAKGRELESSGKLLEARDAYRTAIERDALSLQAHLGLGRTSFAMGLNDEARKAFSQAVELRAGDAEATLGMVRVLHQQGVDTRALRMLEEHLRNNPDDADAFALKGACLLAFGDTARAAEAASRALAIAPRNVDALRTAAEVELKRENFGKAESYYRSAVAADVDNVGGRIGLAVALRAKGDVKQAEEMLTLLFMEHPDHPQIVDELVTTRIAAGKEMQALALCRETVARRPELITLRGTLCKLLLALGLDNEMNIAAQNLLEDHPGDVTAHLCMAALFLKKGLPSLAIPQCTKALAQQPGLVAAHQIHISALMMQGDLEQAANRLRAVLKASPDALPFRLQLGECLMRQGKTDEAFDLLQSDVKAYPGSASLRSLLAQVYFLTGNSQGALSEFRAAKDIAPDDPNALNDLAAGITHIGGDLDEAMEYALKARTLSPNNPHIVDTLAWIHFARKEYEKALLLAQLAVGLGAGEPILLHHHAEILAALGRKAEALESVRRALATGKSFQDMDKARALLRRLEQEGGGEQQR